MCAEGESRTSCSRGVQHSLQGGVSGLALKGSLALRARGELCFAQGEGSFMWWILLGIVGNCSEDNLYALSF